MNNQAPRAGGYTLVEVLIVMAVSSALLLVALLAVAGQRQRTEFTQAVRDVQFMMQDIVNDVATGFTGSVNAIDQCSFDDSGTVTITADSTQDVAEDLGTNQSCAFYGKLIQFGENVSGPDPDRSAVQVYSLVGRPGGAGSSLDVFSAAVTPVTSLVDTITGVDFVDDERLLYGLEYSDMVYTVGALPTSTANGIALVPRLRLNTSNSSNVQSYDVVVWESAESAGQFESEAFVNEFIDTRSARRLVVNPPGGVTICFNSGGTDQSAELTLGGESGVAVPDLFIKDGPCA